jgi:hypothetical protein
MAVLNQLKTCPSVSALYLEDYMIEGMQEVVRGARSARVARLK